MRLPFHYQFILVPFIIVLLLAGLVGYTLIELSRIHRETEISRQWEITTDRVQTAIVSGGQLKNLADDLSSTESIQDNDNFFNYLEQAAIFVDSLTDSYLFERLPASLRADIQKNRDLFIAPESADPMAVSQTVTALLPALEYQYKVLAAKRRSAFIHTHRILLAINSRMTTVLLSSLLLGIAVSSALALWLLTVIRKRLKLLTRRSLAVCAGDPIPATTTLTSRDDLDELERCLTTMASRLLHVIRVENVLRGAENERRRISMDIHDGVLADLTAIDHRLDTLYNKLDETDAIAVVRAEVDHVITSLRLIIDDLHPQVLETLGLESALQSYIERHASGAGFPGYHLEFDQRLEDAIPFECKISLYRIISEAINNVLKHAHCDRFELSVRVVNPNLVVTVEDNGTGMPDKINGGHGCTNIVERAKLIAATVQWRASRFAHGTCFEMSLPLEKAP